MSLHDIVEKSEAKSLSFDDLHRMLGKDDRTTRIINYDDLKNINDISELFNGNVKAIIILLQIESRNAPRVGHWIALLDKPGVSATDVGTIEHFDPYGFSVDKETAITHEEKWLSTLLVKSPKRLIESRRRFQRLREGVNTCGRWCVVRIKQFDMTTREFGNFIDTIHYEPDVAVTLMIKALQLNGRNNVIFQRHKHLVFYQADI